MQESYKLCCKILQDNALFLQTSFKNLARIASFLQVSCKNCFELSVFFIAQNASKTFVSFCFPLQKFSKNLTVDSEPRFSRPFRKRQDWSYPTRRDKNTLDKNCFILYSCSDKLSHYKTNVFRKFLILSAFTDAQLQNTFNRCKVHQILPLTVDHACFLVKCINYQNVMCVQMIYFLQDLARFLW